MQDVKISNLELFYDVLDESNNLLYEATKSNYFELIEMTADNILEGKVLSDVDESYVKKLKKIYKKLDNVDFSVEDIRKALQSIILRGFKEMRIPNGNTTPDTLGIFMSYLITKLTDKKEINVFDPMCGVGNLLFTISNYLDKKTSLYACDIDPWMTKLTKISADLMDTNVEIFMQDMMSLNLSNIDIVVSDIPTCLYENDKFFPYEAMLHMVDSLNDNGSMICIIQNDFFDYDKDQKFKKALLDKISIVGICELPDDMFKVGKPKSILVLQKKEIKDQCFMVKLPSFSNVTEFNDSLKLIESWFLKNK